MGKTAAAVMVDALLDWGVEVVFGLPGDGINGIMEALRQQRERIRFVQVRHEEAAAFAACGYAKFTGRLGVCLATSGPGGLNMLSGLYDAKLDGQPVLAITGHTYHDLIGTYYQQDVDLDKVFIDVAVYNQRVMGPQHTRAVTDLACRHAIARRGVAHLTFPVDLQDLEVEGEEPSKMKVPGHTSAALAQAIVVPPPDALRRAADVLNAGERVVILAGRGALGAGGELESLAEMLAAPIVKAYLGKGAVPDDSPYTTGGIGLLGTAPSEDAMEGADTLLIVGSSIPYMQYLPKPGQARGVQIDADPTRIGLRYPVEVGMVGDARATLELLLPLLERKAQREFLTVIQERMGEWRTLLTDQAQRPDSPMKPQAVATALGERLAPDAIICGDSGSNTVWLARNLQVRRGQQVSGSGTLASMASALPYAIAAQVAFPDRQVVATVGDGGFSQLMAEFATAVREKLPIKVVLFKNDLLAQIKWEQLVFLGNPEYGVTLQPIDFVKVAEACGGTGLRVEDPAMLGDTLDRALAMPGPVLVEAVIDPFEPPMPAKIAPQQAVNMAKALARGEPNRDRIATTIFRTKTADLLANASDDGPLATVKEKLREVVRGDD